MTSAFVIITSHLNVAKFEICAVCVGLDPLSLCDLWTHCSSNVKAALHPLIQRPTTRHIENPHSVYNIQHLLNISHHYKVELGVF